MVVDDGGQGGLKQDLNSSSCAAGNAGSDVFNSLMRTARAWSFVERSEPFRCAISGITFGARPEAIWPMVKTAGVRESMERGRF